MSDKDLILKITPISPTDDLEKIIDETLNSPEYQAMIKPFQDLSLVETDPERISCDHGVIFDEEEYKKHQNMSEYEVRKRWPRGWGPCPKGCGFDGIAYASWMHFIAGDW